MMGAIEWSSEVAQVLGDAHVRARADDVVICRYMTRPLWSIALCSGTPAESSMATSIRAVWIDHVTRSLVDAYPSDSDRAALDLDIILRLVNSIPDASWWLDDRHNLREAFGPAWRAEMEKAEQQEQTGRSATDTQ